MNLIKRISTSITTSVDRAVSKVENHDAIIDAALKETQTAAARSRVRLARVKKDGASLIARHREQVDGAHRWGERARGVAQTDEKKALDCLRRRQECQRQAHALEASLASHRELEDKVSANLKKIEARVSEVSHQRNMMRSRQSVAEAMRVINKVEGVSYGEIEDTFDRWEITLGESEMVLGAGPECDPLDVAFTDEENDTALRAELAQLLDDRDGAEA